MADVVVSVLVRPRSMGPPITGLPVDRRLGVADVPAAAKVDALAEEAASKAAIAEPEPVEAPAVTEPAPPAPEPAAAPSTAPSTTGMSKFNRALTVRLPSPWKAKTFSTKKAPASKAANQPEMAVMTGLRALGRACLKTTLGDCSPLERAVCT